MAEHRAAEDALRRIYLAKGVNGKQLPSDSLVGEWVTPEEYLVGDDEVQWSSSGKSGKLATQWEKEAWSERERVRGLLQDT